MEPNLRQFHGLAAETPRLSPENKHEERLNSFCESHPGPVLRTGELPEESKSDQQNLRPAVKREWAALEDSDFDTECVCVGLSPALHEVELGSDISPLFIGVV